MPSRKQPSGDTSEWVLTLSPPGPNCSMGYSSNEAVSWDGSSSYGRENEDRSYMCAYKDKQLFMVLDGHDGSKAVKFAYTYLPHLLLSSDMNGGEERVMKVIREAILRTEMEFFVGIDPYITRKVTLMIEIEQKVPDLNSSAAVRLFPTQISEIDRLDDLIRGGTTVVLALILQNKLYVANVGDSRALLCIQQPGHDGGLVVKQLSVDHNTKNEDELRRLEGCGLDPRELRDRKRLGIHQNTRSIGDYSIKGGYANMDILRHATCEPGTAEPHIHEPVDLSSCQGFLILMSDGLYEAYETWTGRPDCVNEDVAHLVAKELKNSRNDETIVAQSVVDKVKFLYRETCKKSGRSGRLDDITLIVKGLGVSRSQSVSLSSHQSYPLPGVPHTAPPSSSKHFEFGGHPPSSFQHQPSVPATTATQSYQQPPYPPTSHHQAPPTSHHQPPFHHASSHQPPVSHQADYRRGGAGYDNPMDAGNFGRGEGEGGEPQYSRQQGVRIMGPDVSDRRQDGRYGRDQQWQNEPSRRVDGGKIGPHPPGPTRLVSEPDQYHSGGYANQYGPAARSQSRPAYYSPEGQYPGGDEYGRGFSFQQQPGQGTFVNTEFQGASYQHQNPNARQADGGPDRNQRFQQDYAHNQNPSQQQQFGHSTGTGQHYQGVSYQSPGSGQHYQDGLYQNQTQAKPADPVHQGFQQGMGHQTQNQSFHDSSYYRDESAQNKHNSSDIELARSDPFYQGSQDATTPQPMVKVTFRQQSSSSFTSDTSSSSELTLMHQPSMPTLTENETLNEGEGTLNEGVGTVTSPPQTNCASKSSNSDPDDHQAAQQDAEGLRSMDSTQEGYITVSEGEDTEEEEEEQPDGSSMLKPYIKFGEQFPSDLSWYDIETSS